MAWKKSLTGNVFHALRKGLHSSTNGVEHAIAPLAWQSLSLINIRSSQVCSSGSPCSKGWMRLFPSPPSRLLILHLRTSFRSGGSSLLLNRVPPLFCGGSALARMAVGLSSHRSTCELKCLFGHRVAPLDVFRESVSNSH